MVKQSEETKRKRVESRKKTCEERGYYMTDVGKRSVGKKNAVHMIGNIPWNKNKIGLQVAWNKDLTKDMDERVNQISESLTGKTLSSSTRRKIGLKLRGKLSGDKNPSKRPDVRAKISFRAQERKRLGLKRAKCSDESIKYRMTRTLQSLNHKRPTSYEKQIQEVVSENKLPYKYTGNGDFWITSEGKHLNPDFVNTNGQKIVLEPFAKIHKRLQYGSVEHYTTERARLFGNFGWEVVFFNEDDLKRSDWKEHCLSKITSVEKN